MIYLKVFWDIEHELKPEIWVYVWVATGRVSLLRSPMLPFIGRQRRRSLIVLKIEELIMENERKATSN